VFFALLVLPVENYHWSNKVFMFLSKAHPLHSNGLARRAVTAALVSIFFQ